nr:reverse transcriptase family protein [Pseudonocardia acaciae]
MNWLSLAQRALDGPWLQGPLAERLGDELDPAAAERLASAVLAHRPRMPWTEQARFARELAEIPDVVAALAPGNGRGPRVLVSPEWRPVWRWPVPEWTTTEHLAHALDLTPGELAWFADSRGWLRRHRGGPLPHYRHRWLRTRGGVPRLLEAPKPLLAERQRRLLRHLLRAIPTHPAAHGFARGRSVLTFARPHAGKDLVLRFDLEGFFSCIGAARVAGLMRWAGYPGPVATALTGLMVTATPPPVLREAPPPAGPGQVDARRRLLTRLAGTHLAQGAPSSPALANLVAYSLDRRLSALARERGLAYTRYADDIALSGDHATSVPALRRAVSRIARDEGFRIRADKTRVMPSHRRQRLTGLVVNAEPAVARDEYDTLRALLHNCARTGPTEQNRTGHPDFAAHVRGRIAWVAATHPGRGEKLLAQYRAIRWPTPS